MASKKQIAANRRNARKSTGPRTSAGKAKSSMNALKHGLRAATPLLPGESEEEFTEFCAEILDAWEPVGGMERFLTERLAILGWRSLRAFRVEGELYLSQIAANRIEAAQERAFCELWKQRPRGSQSARDVEILQQMAGADQMVLNQEGPSTELGDAFCEAAASFSCLSVCQARTSGEFFRTLKVLKRLQDERRAAAGPSATFEVST